MYRLLSSLLAAPGSVTEHETLRTLLQLQNRQQPSLLFRLLFGEQRQVRTLTVPVQQHKDPNDPGYFANYE